MSLDKEINQSLNVLKKGGLILYPTDTVWGIGCDATNPDAIKKVYALKKRDDSKALICMVNDFRMLGHYVEEVPEVAYDILKNTQKPTTIIYDNPIRIASNLVANDNTLAIRVVRHRFCQELIKKLKRPLVSTSANISGQPTPKSFKEIHADIINGVDYVVKLEKEKVTTKPSSIIKLSNNGLVNIIRK
ncbi:L-threonylcarbamoyladenylate synthase [Spongiivirga sp. MCCC 1A20706]|uniref:L-threonylcarbamoyladenylate synthase n=1 Tax=Spongiivirga sp. MCCC 1A20706 TaxID=3160963 RepID=UPI00397726EE